MLDRLQSQGQGTRSAGLGWYAAVQVWAEAVQRAGTLEIAAVIKMLRRGRFDTVLGRVAFDDNGDLKGASWQWQQWTDGTYVPLGERQLGTRTFGPALPPTPAVLTGRSRLSPAYRFLGRETPGYAASAD